MSGRFRYGALPAAGLILAALSITGQAAAQGLVYGPEAKAGEIAVACFSRRYDKAHLSAHRQQNVTQMVALAYRLPDAPASESVFNMTVRFRGAAEEQQFPGVCRPASGGLSCNVECDGGAFSDTVRDENSVLVDLAAGIGSCDADAGFGPDDKVFRLDRSSMSSCRDLIWDDDLRRAILKAGRLNP